MLNYKALILCVWMCCHASSWDQALSATEQQAVPLAGGTSPTTWAFPAKHVAAAYARQGMVTSTDRIASDIGAEILRRGGNAIDAAVAVHFALAVVNPEAGNIGGGGFMVAHIDGQHYALDFREKAPLLAHATMFAEASSRLGHLAVGVPGSVAGMWQAHQRFGSLPWADLVQPAVHLAEGIVVHHRLAMSLQRYAERLRSFPQTQAIFLPNNHPPRVGDRLVQSDLAATLQRIARDGRDGFYTGMTAELLVAEMQRGQGIISQDDLQRYRAVWRDPITFSYRQHQIISMPPPSSGGVTLAQILLSLDGLHLDSMPLHSTAYVHYWAEVSKRAFADRNALLGDPDFNPALPIDTLVSASYAASRRASIDPVQAQPSLTITPGLPAAKPTATGGTDEGNHTTHYSIVDTTGNAVSVTTTINSLYGSRVVVNGAGFLLNNEMDDFATKPGEPNQFGLIQGELNAIAPEKRMLSSMTPTIVVDANNNVRIVTGSPGGPTIISSVAQIISHILDYRMDPVAATAAPRLHHQHLPDTIFYEDNGLSSETIKELEVRGHHLKQRNGFQGDTQTIFITDDQTMVGVADRRGGAAIGVGPVHEVMH